MRVPDLDSTAIALKADAMAEAVRVGLAKPRRGPAFCLPPGSRPDRDGCLILLDCPALGWRGIGPVDWERIHWHAVSGPGERSDRPEAKALMRAMDGGSPPAVLREAERLVRLHDPDGEPSPEGRAALERIVLHASVSADALERAGEAVPMGERWRMLGSPLRPALAHGMAAALRGRRATRRISTTAGLDPAGWRLAPRDMLRGLPPLARVRRRLEAALEGVRRDIHERKRAGSAPGLDLDRHRRKAIGLLRQAASDSLRALAACGAGP